jgi:hypothetical protein
MKLKKVPSKFLTCDSEPRKNCSFQILRIGLKIRRFEINDIRDSLLRIQVCSLLIS